MARSDEAVTIAFRLPRSLHEQLKRAAGKESNVSEEIRRRLEASFKIPDKTTEELINAIAMVASLLSIDGNWHEDPFLHEVMTAAMNRLLDHWKPNQQPRVPRKHDLLDEDMKPESAGRMLVATALALPGGMWT
jgi:hypothetical protein